MRWGPSIDGKTLWFVWRPVRLYNGQWVWLEWVRCYEYFDSRVPAGAVHSLFRRVYYPLEESL